MQRHIFVLALGILLGASCSSPTAPTPSPPQVTFVDITIRYTRPAEYHTTLAAAGFQVFRGSGGEQGYPGTWDNENQVLVATVKVPLGKENLISAIDRATPSPSRIGRNITAEGMGQLPVKGCDWRAPEDSTCAILLIQQ